MRFPAGKRRGWRGAACALLLASLSIPVANARPQSSSTSSPGSQAKTSSKKKHRNPTTHGKSAAATGHLVAGKGRRSSRHRVRGQQKIDSERAQAIQKALVREHYLTGEPTGTWNQESEEAMRRYQADHGWQSKTVPDSRALISLGLGPSNDHLLNPESAAITRPNPPRAASLNPGSHSAAVNAAAGKTPAADPSPASTSSQDVSNPQ